MPVTGPGQPWSRRGGLSVPTGAGGGAPAEPMTYTIFGDASDGYEGSDSGDSFGSVDTAGDIYIGQSTGARYAGFLAFDTSAVVGTITSVTLSVYGMNDSSATDFTIEARLHDWDVSLGAADWLPAGSQAAKTLVATFDTSGFNAAGYNALTSEAAFLSSINQSGFTRLVLCSSRHRAGDIPSGNEFVGIRSADSSDTSQDPKLVIEALV